MQKPQINERVRLLRSLPELSLESGSVGIVQSVWFAPTPAYEVEFPTQSGRFPVRALLLAESIQRAGN
jgi:hypothetical protein